MERLAPRYGQEAAGAVAAWSAPLGRVEASVLQLVRAVRRKAPVCLVSNATTRLERDLDALGLRAELDVVINSSRVGARKPDRRIFARRWTRWGCPRRRPSSSTTTRAWWTRRAPWASPPTTSPAPQPSPVRCREAGLLPAAEDIVRRGMSPS